MSSSSDSRLQQAWRLWATHWQAPHALWWGPDGLWDAGVQRGSRPSLAAQRHDDIAAWCAAHPGRSARLWLSAWWVVDLLVDAALPLADDAALMAYVRPLLRHYHGEAAAPWSLAAWHSGEQRGVSALHGQRLGELRDSARAHGVRLLQVQPWWARALALAAAQPALRDAQGPQRLLLVEGRLLTVIDLDAGRLAGLQQRRLAEASLAALADWLDQQAGQPCAQPPACCWLLGWGLETVTQALPAASESRPMPTSVPAPLQLLDRPERLLRSHPDPRWWQGQPSLDAVATR